MQNAKRSMHNSLLVFCILHFALCIGCSIPNLEPQSCIDSRTSVREFYSFHFGNDMHFSHENLKLRQRFLTQDFVQYLTGWSNPGDPFTTGDEDVPKAFRVGECREIANDRAEFQVLLFWRDDTRSEQREIKVETVRSPDRWLVNNVSK